MTDRQRCLDRIEECYQIVEKRYNTKLTRPTVIFNSRFTKTAGDATSFSVGRGKYRGGEIRLSTKLLELNPEAFIAETPGHEAAHIIACDLYGKEGSGHGTRWRQIMHQIGQEAAQYHKFRVPASRSFLYITKCGQEKTLTIRRHNKLQRGVYTYYQWPDKTKVFAKDFIEEISG